MTAKNTSIENPSQEQTAKKRQRLKPRPPILRGIPLGMVCRVCDVLEFTGIDQSTWDSWVEVAADLELPNKGTHAQFTLTDRIHAFLESDIEPVKKERKARQK